jgi:hypothetical protein
MEPSTGIECVPAWLWRDTDGYESAQNQAFLVTEGYRGVKTVTTGGHKMATRFMRQERRKFLQSPHEGGSRRFIATRPSSLFRIISEWLVCAEDSQEKPHDGLPRR